MLAAYLDYPPDGAAKHMPCRQRSDHESLSFSLQLDRLVVLQLGDLLEASIHLVQSEEVELFNVVSCLQKLKLPQFLDEA